MPSDQPDEITELVVRPEQFHPLYLAKAQPMKGKATDSKCRKYSPSSISLEESFDIAYAHLRAKGDKNLIEEMERSNSQSLTGMWGNQVKASALLGITRAT